MPDAPRPPPWRNPRKGRDQILPSGNPDGEARVLEIRQNCGCSFRAEFELEEEDAEENNFGCHVFMALHGTRTFGGTKSPRGIVSCGVVHFEKKPEDGVGLPIATVPNEGEYEQVNISVEWEWVE